MSVRIFGSYEGRQGSIRASIARQIVNRADNSVVLPQGWAQEFPLDPSGNVEFIVPAVDDLTLGTGDPYLPPDKPSDWQVRIEEKLDDGPAGTAYFLTPTLADGDVDLTKAPVPSAGTPSIIGTTLDAVLPTLVPMDMVGAPGGVAELNSAAHVEPTQIAGFSPLTVSGFLAARKELRPVTGSKSSGAALQSLLTQLVALGLITDGTVV